MDNKLNQQQKILQKMSLTPQMRHSIQLLNMSVKDLNEYIDTVLSTNPLLEKRIEHKGPKPISYEYKDEIKTKEEVNPREIILSQIRTLGLSEKDFEIAEYLTYEMNDDGYIKVDLEEVARDLFVDLEDVERVLEVIQNLSPTGIGARDIKECLQIQLKCQQKENSLEYRIVTDFITDLAINDIAKIIKALAADKEMVRQAVNKIKSLNPRPGSTIFAKTPQPVIPDLIATIKNKKVRLEINREAIPHLRLYNPYADKLDVVKDPEAREFLKENMDAAKELIDNIKRREETMCRVADYILKFQQDHLENGASHVKSLTPNDVAKALNLHPSTISRATSNKYVQLNSKVVSLKSFLSHSIKNGNGEIASKAYVKNRIRELVDKEDKVKSLSDNAIKEMLQEEGIPIKRRTVHKYRESLRILPAYLRKKKSI